MKFNKFMYGLQTLHKPIVYDNEPLIFFTKIHQRQKKTQKGANIVVKIKRQRDKMKTETDKYEQMQKKENKRNLKIKEKKE